MSVIQGDEFGSLAEFSAPTLDVQYSFSNFSFKVSPVNLNIFSPLKGTLDAR